MAVEDLRQDTFYQGSHSTFDAAPNSEISTSQDEAAFRNLQGRKILYVVNYLEFFLSHRLRLALAAKNQGAEVLVASPDQHLATKIERHGITHVTIPLARWGLNPLQDIQTVAALYSLYKKARPDLVHHITIKSVIYGGLAARLAGVSSVVQSVTGMGYIFYSRGIRARLRRTLVVSLYRLGFLCKNQTVIVQNEDNRSFFISRGLVKTSSLTLIPGAGVDGERFHTTSEPEGTPCVLLLARLQWAKGIREFATAARTLSQAGIKARFIIAGGFDKGSPDGLTSDDTSRLSTETSVEFLGEIEDVPEIIQRSHIVCLPSYSEGLPKALIEATASARAIVASDIAGCRAVVRNGYNGLLVPARDAESLAEALKALLQDPLKRKEMAQNSRLLFEEKGLDERNILTQTLAVYSNLIASADSQGQSPS